MITPEQWHQMHKELTAAGGRKLDVTAIEMGKLHNDYWIKRWLEDGLSFNLDIIPAIKRTVASNHCSPCISSWKYFDKPVRIFHHRRTRDSKVAPSSHADCKAFHRDDPPEEPLEVRKRAVAEWNRKKEEMLRDGN